MMPTERRLRGRANASWIRRVLWTQPAGRFGVATLALLVLIAIAGFILSPHDAYSTDGVPLQGPSVDYWLGTDNLGRDLLSRIAVGVRITAINSLAAAGLALVAGSAIGLLAGYAGGMLDTVVMRGIDILLAFPSIVLAIAMATILGTGNTTLVLAIATSSLPAFARLARSTTMSEKTLDYVAADVAAGGSQLQILTSGILPNILSPLIVYFSVALPNAATLEATLSFLGLGAMPPTPTLGGMIDLGRQFLRNSVTFGIFPGVALFMLILSTTLIGKSVSAASDPSRRFRRVKVSA
jgi:peptide/nickel transport system permease protein